MQVINVEKLIEALKVMECENISEKDMQTLFYELGDRYIFDPISEAISSKKRAVRTDVSNKHALDVLEEHGGFEDITCLTSTGILDRILINERILPEDFKENMPVYDATDDRYYRLRFIYKTDEYVWCDDWGNNIDGHELWKYNFRED